VPGDEPKAGNVDATFDAERGGEARKPDMRRCSEGVEA